jgi:hypothetical protein
MKAFKNNKHLVSTCCVLGICLSLFCAAITEYLRLGKLEQTETYLAYCSGGWEAQDQEATFDEGPSCYIHSIG